MRGLKTSMNDALIGNEIERPVDGLIQNDENQEKFAEHHMVKTVKTEPIEIIEISDSETDDIERNYYQNVKSELDLIDIRNERDPVTALKKLGNGMHPSILNLKSINDIDYVGDIKREVVDDAACDSLIETIEQHFEEIDKFICGNLNDKNGFNNGPERGNTQIVKVELQEQYSKKKVANSLNLDLKDVLNGFDTGKYDTTKERDVKPENCDLNDCTEDLGDFTSDSETEPYCDDSDDERAKINDENAQDDSHEMDIDNNQGAEKVDGVTFTEGSRYGGFVSDRDSHCSVASEQDFKKKFKISDSEKLDIEDVLNAVDKYETTNEKSEKCDFNEGTGDYEDFTSGSETDLYCEDSGDEREKTIGNEAFAGIKYERQEMDVDNIPGLDRCDGGPITEKSMPCSVTADINFLKMFNEPQCNVQLKDISMNNLDKAESLNNLDKTESMVVIKTIKEDDTAFSEIVMRSELHEGIMKCGESSFKCTLCGEICKNENEAKQHAADFGCIAYNSAWKPKDKGRSHSKSRPFQCTMCKLCFTDRKSLRKHSYESHGKQERIYPCDICLKVFKRANHVEAHKMCVHSDIRAFVCNVCGRSYKGRGSLSLHMRSHNGVYETCETCGHNFRDPGDLRKHIRAVHLKIKNFKCDICGHASSNQSNLNQHLKSHLDKSIQDKKFQCEECNWRTVNASQLRVHMKTHIKTLDYKCPHCEKQFTCEDYLNKHVRNMHDITGETFQCTQCPKSFARKGYLNKHMKLHKVARPYKCQICGATYVYSNHLQRHIQYSHEGKKWERKTCDVCGKNVAHLKQHMQSHVTDKPFNCERCGKKFLTEKRLKLHYRVHLDVKPYFCQGCDVGFARKEFYCTHMKRFHDIKLSTEEAELRGRIENMEFTDSDGVDDDC